MVGAVLIATIPLAWMQPKTLLRALPVDMPTPPELAPPGFDFSKSAVQTQLAEVSQQLDQLSQVDPLAQGKTGNKLMPFVGVWDIVLGCYSAAEAQQVMVLLQSYDFRAYQLSVDQFLSRYPDSSAENPSFGFNQCERDPEGAAEDQPVGVSIGPYLRQSKAALDLEGLEGLKFDVISKPEVVEYWPWN